VALQLPPAPKIDRSRLGVLTMAPSALHLLLGLPRDHEITGLRLTLAGDLQIDIAGADMPGPGYLPRPVTLICHHQVGQPLELSWEHLPDKRWTLP
jgi:hypothetical protein